MCRFTSFVTVLVLAAASTVRADFALWDSEHLEVASPHSVGVLYDSSTVDLAAGGSITNAYVNDEALLQVLGGSVGWDGTGALFVYNAGKVDVATGYVYNLSAYDTSDIHIIGGGVAGDLYAFNTSTVNISGGTINMLRPAHSSTVNISGGTIKNFSVSSESILNISGGIFPGGGYVSSGTVNISGGTFSLEGSWSLLRVAAAGTANISGGTFSGDLQVSGRLNASDINFGNLLVSGGGTGGTVSISDSDFTTLQASGNSTVDIFSGSSFDNLDVSDTSSVIFHGYDFRVLGNLRLEDEMVTGATGELTGKWFDGTPWSVTISTFEPTATIWVVPEPSTLVLLGMGVVGLLAYGWRRSRVA